MTQHCTGIQHEFKKNKKKYFFYFVLRWGYHAGKMVKPSHHLTVKEGPFFPKKGGIYVSKPTTGIVNGKRGQSQL